MFGCANREPDPEINSQLITIFNIVHQFGYTHARCTNRPNRNESQTRTALWRKNGEMYALAAAYQQTRTHSFAICACARVQSEHGERVFSACTLNVSYIYPLWTNGTFAICLGEKACVMVMQHYNAFRFSDWTGAAFPCVWWALTVFHIFKSAFKRRAGLSERYIFKKLNYFVDCIRLGVFFWRILYFIHLDLDGGERIVFPIELSDTFIYE